MGINSNGLVHGLGTILSGVTEMLGGAQGAAAPAAAPQQQAPAVGLPTADQFQAAAPAGGAGQAAPAGAAAPAAPAGGGDQLTQALGQLVQLLQQLVQQLTGGAQGQAGAGAAGGDPNAAGAAGAGAGAGTAAANAANGQTVTSVSPDGSAVATASAGAGASASAQAGGAAAAAAPGADSGASAAGAGAGAGIGQAIASGVAGLFGGGGGGGGGLFGGGDDPLMFNLDGKGAGFDTSKKIGANLNGQGTEQVNDLKSGTGLLTFDATPQDGAATQFDGNKGKLTHTFGNKTDLSAYGIKGDQPDGTFSNGFSALRAAGEHFGMIRPGKQYLDGNDMKQLESKIGLKMQVGGLNGQSKSLGELGISRIDLGQANATESKAQGTRDANGNIIQHQQGANFTINGQQRDYVDGWFRPDGAARA